MVCQKRSTLCIHYLIRSTLGIMTLDCESFESTLGSLSNIFDANPQSVLQFLKSETPEKNENVKHSLDEAIYKKFKDAFPGSPNHSHTFWFHVTRVQTPGAFLESGILPTDPSRANQIWNFLRSLLISSGSNNDVRNFDSKNFLNESSVFIYKLDNPRNYGPFAMLIREPAFKPKPAGYHDDLRFPEIVEDICQAYGGELGQTLIQLYQSATISCIVKISSQRLAPHYLRVAIFYLWTVVQGLEMDHRTNTGVNFRRRILPSRIVSIEEIQPKR